MFFRPDSTELSICTAIGVSPNNCFTSPPLELHKQVLVYIQQSTDPTDRKKFIFRAEVDGKPVITIHNTSPKFFRNVQVWKGNPWHTPAAATIGGVFYKNWDFCESLFDSVLDIYYFINSDLV